MFVRKSIFGLASHLWYCSLCCIFRLGRPRRHSNDVLQWHLRLHHANTVWTTGGKKKGGSFQLHLVAYERLRHTPKMSYLECDISYFDCRTFKMLDGALEKSMNFNCGGMCDTSSLLNLLNPADEQDRLPFCHFYNRRASWFFTFGLVYVNSNPKRRKSNFFTTPPPTTP